MHSRTGHYPSKAGKARAISGGGFLTAFSSPAAPSSSSSSAAAATLDEVVPTPGVASDDDDDDFEEVPEASASSTPVSYLGQKSFQPLHAPAMRRSTSSGSGSGSRSRGGGEVDGDAGGFVREDNVGRDLPPQPAVKKKRKPPPKVGEAAGKGKAKARQSDFVATVEWPPHFVELEKTFKALNTIYTFCSTRKAMATTFEMLKGGVENLLKRPLEIHDMAQIKSLLPNLVSFAYIDSELLRIHSAGGDEDKARRERKRQELDEAYELAGGKGAPARPKKDETVLLFSFNDGELRAVNGADKIFLRKFAKRRKKDDPPQVKPHRAPEPKFTASSMAALIAKRNLKFTEAVSELLVACAAHDPPEDPIELLLAATEDHLPVRPGSGPKGGEEERKGAKEKRDDLDFYRRFPDMRMSIEDLIEEMKEQEDYNDQIVEGGHRVFEAREAVYGELDEPLSPGLLDALYSTSKITRLYSHQALAVNLLGSRKNVIISTSTSSGKSLIYQIPMLKALECDPSATGLYIFPTKALAQDQKRGFSDLLNGWMEMEHVKVATFDGDTPKGDRDYIRENANVLFTNPDMLHLTILPNEEKWRTFFRNLKYVVVDELHIYAGLFGCHVAFIMRRLRRVCAALGNRRVQFVCCSATISNPAEHMRAIFGIEDVEVIDVDGSPTGRKEYVVWNPSYIDERDLKQGRVSTIAEASRIFRFLMDRGIRAIVFCKVRMQCEILMKQVRADLMVEGRSDMAERVMSYRSGYSPADRRKIEAEMFSGRLLGVIATTALELGIDIGSLDAVISVGFPYTLPGLRQQAGRAGRRNKDSLAMLICDPFPVDQHYAKNPDEIFTSPFTELSLDLDNPIVFEAHAQCAADELPIRPSDDVAYFGAGLERICLDRLVADDEGFYHCHSRYKPYPARTVSIRNTEDEKYDVVDITDGRAEVLEEVEFSRAIFTVYEGAVFMHQGRTFVTKHVDHDTKIAKVEQCSINWRTRNRDFTNVDPQEALAIREIEGSETTAYYGLVKIESIVFGYFKTDNRNNILDTVDISSPPFIRSSHGFWINVPRSALEILLMKNLHPAASIHAAEHAIMGLTPIVAMCIDGDVRTECKQPEKELASTPSSRKRPARIILYDASGKSGGICAKAFDHISMLVKRAADVLTNCPCSEGCPSCVASSMCSGANLIVSKLGARVVLDSILNRPIDVDAIPIQPLATGVVPGGSIDLAGAGVRPEFLNGPKVTNGPQSSLGTRRGEMATEEMSPAEEAERAAALAELIG